MQVDGYRVAAAGVRAGAGDRGEPGIRPLRIRVDHEGLGVPAALARGHEVAGEHRAVQRVLGGQGLTGVPDQPGHGSLVQRVELLERAGEVHDLAHRGIGGGRCGRVDEQRDPGRAQLGVAGREAEAVAGDPQLGGPGREAALGVVPQVRHDPRRQVGVRVVEAVPARVGPHGPGVIEAVAELERDPAAVRQRRLHDQAGGHVAAGDVELQEGAGRGGRARLVVDEPGVPDDGTALRRGRERGLGGDPVLQVAELVAGRAEQLGQHHAEVRLVTLDPLRVGAGGVVQQGRAEAGEVLGQVVDQRAAAGQRRAGRRRGAIQRGRAAGLERERDVSVVGVQDRRGDPQPVAGEIAAEGRAQRQRRPALLVQPPVGGGDRQYRHGRHGLAAGDRHRSAAGQAARDGHPVEEVHPQPGLVGAGDLDEVDPVQRRRGDELGQAIGHVRPPAQSGSRPSACRPGCSRR